MRFALCHPTEKHYAKDKCRPCYQAYMANRTPEITEKTVKRLASWHVRNRDKTKDSRLKRTYGISLLEVLAIQDAQGSRCAICAEPSDKLNVDHHHDTGTVRGLLCGKCNRGIGNLKECPDILLKAIKYLLYWANKYKDKRDVRQRITKKQG